MKQRLQCYFVVLLLAGPISAAHAGDVHAGKQKAARCAACHGSEGISVYDAWPNLAGQDPKYLVTQLKAYKAGTRKNPMMYPMVFDLTDTDMSDLAAYYSELHCP